LKAILLAAGKGTRLKPFTDTVPKCLMPIHGKTLLEIWLDLFEKYGISDVLINTHHHSAKVEDFIENIKKDRPIKIVTTYERELLGSGGTVFANKAFVADTGDFIIAYADNLTNINLENMIDSHRLFKSKGGIITIGLFRAPDPTSCGIAIIDEENRVLNFIEKPKNPKTNLANCGIYISTQKIFNDLAICMEKRENDILDFGFHVLPELSGKMFGYEIKGYLRDIGTSKSYYEALEEWPLSSKG
jgi:mannose-1-phosphate guanylyltransferase